MVAKVIDEQAILVFLGTVELGCVEKKQADLDNFLSGVERSAFRIAEIATRNADDALDIVQDSMIKLVEKYSDKPSAEWRPLFYSILRSRITTVKKRLLIEFLVGFLKKILLNT